MSLDALFVGPVLSQRLEEWLLHAHGVEGTRVLLVASHTHFAPALDPSRPRLGSCDAQHLGWVAERIIGLLEGLFTGARAPLHAAAGVANAPLAIHRRRPWWIPHLSSGRISLAPVNAAHAAGPRDPRMTVVRLRAAAESRDAAFIVHFACHPTAFPRLDVMTAEYIGMIRKELRQHSPGAPVVFLQGFAGDIRPLPGPHRAYGLRQAILFLLGGPSDRSHTETSWRTWASRIGAAAAAARDVAPRPERVEAVMATATHVMLAEIASVPRETGTVAFRRMTIGKVVDLIAVSAEPVTELRSHLPEGALGVGYLGDVYGYWPTDAQLREGGYEAEGFIDAFHLGGRLRPGRDAIFRRAVGELMRDTFLT